MMKTQPAALLVTLLAFLGNAAWAKPTVDTEFVPDYDYTQTRYIVFYGNDDYVVLANPFEFPAPVVGALVYQIILKYAPKLEALEAPPSQPTHTLDLIMLNQHGKWRIGQRLYLGDAWLFDGKSIAYLDDEDYQQLVSLLRQRYTGQERHSSHKLANLRRPQSAELPDGWLPQPQSVAEAASRMGIEDDSTQAEPEGNTPTTNSRAIEDEGPAAPAPSSSTASKEPNPRDKSISPGFNKTPALNVSEVRTYKVTDSKPYDELPTEKSGFGAWFWTLSVLALFGLLLIWAIRRRKNQ